jgi:hypothetical protein
MMATLIGATAFSVCTTQLRAQPQEYVAWKYYVHVSGGTRQPRTPTQVEFANLAGPSPETCATLAQGGVCLDEVWKEIVVSPAVSYALAYVSIQGGAEGAVTVFPDASGSVPATVEIVLPDTPHPQINVIAYYFPEGGSCPPGMVCGTAYIDQFDEVQGALESDTFVNVLTTPPLVASPSLTNTGNVDGYVTTATSAVQIDAIPTTTEDRIFDRWIGGPGAAISGGNLSVGKGVILDALALYRSACPSGYSWDTGPTIGQCTAVPAKTTCLDGEVWNVKLKKCIPSPPCHMCPRGQVCMVVGYECNCLKCSTPGGSFPQVKKEIQ